MNKKKEREFIQNKYDGKCAYCGCDLPKKWHVDELLPVRRNFKWNKDKTKYVHDGTCEHPERFDIDNQMPSCPSCNIIKSSMPLESFRQVVSGFIKSLNRDSTQYKTAKRYGLISETNIEVVFHFEKQNVQIEN